MTDTPSFIFDILPYITSRHYISLDLCCGFGLWYFSFFTFLSSCLTYIFLNFEDIILFFYSPFFFTVWPFFIRFILCINEFICLSRMINFSFLLVSLSFYSISIPSIKFYLYWLFVFFYKFRVNNYFNFKILSYIFKIVWNFKKNVNKKLLRECRKGP